MSKKLGFWGLVDCVLDFVAVFVALTTLWWIWQFFHSPPQIAFSATLVVIQGVPFPYIASSLFGMSLASAYRSVKALLRAEHLTPK
jgi:hypothetical protein